MIVRSDFLNSLIATLALPATTPAAPERSFNVLVLGDSIAWGQGLKPEHRWRTLLVDYLTTALKRPVREVPSEIHSGAIIGIGDRNEIDLPGLYQPGVQEQSFLARGPYAGELPSGTPTILAELDALDASPDKNTPIDLVVVSAGINDVRVTRILDPIARDKYIADLVQLHCHEHLTALLDRIRTRIVERNPGCRVAVLSYFRIISQESTNFPSVYDFVSALLTEPPRSEAERHRQRVIQGLASADQQLQPPSASPQPTSTSAQPTSTSAQPKSASAQATSSAPYTSYKDLPTVVKWMIDAAERFYTESERAIGAAVDDANRAPFSPAFVHVTPRIANAQAVFVAPPNSAALWEVRFADRAVFPVDEVFDERDALCRKLYASPKEAAELNECRIASLGHPDVAGAQHGYLDAILSAISDIVR